MPDMRVFTLKSAVCGFYSPSSGWRLIDSGHYSGTRVDVSRNHGIQVDATIRERRP
jgi:hypothetical protein